MLSTLYSSSDSTEEELVWLFSGTRVPELFAGPLDSMHPLSPDGVYALFEATSHQPDLSRYCNDPSRYCTLLRKLPAQAKTAAQAKRILCYLIRKHALDPDLRPERVPLEILLEKFPVLNGRSSFSQEYPQLEYGYESSYGVVKEWIYTGKVNCEDPRVQIDLLFFADQWDSQELWEAVERQLLKPIDLGHIESLNLFVDLLARRREWHRGEQWIDLLYPVVSNTIPKNALSPDVLAWFLEFKKICCRHIPVTELSIEWTHALREADPPSDLHSSRFDILEDAYKELLTSCTNPDDKKFIELVCKKQGFRFRHTSRGKEMLDTRLIAWRPELFSLLLKINWGSWKLLRWAICPDLGSGKIGDSANCHLTYHIFTNNLEKFHKSITTLKSHTSWLGCYRRCALNDWAANAFKAHVASSFMGSLDLPIEPMVDQMQPLCPVAIEYVNTEKQLEGAQFCLTMLTTKGLTRPQARLYCQEGFILQTSITALVLAKDADVALVSEVARHSPHLTAFYLPPTEEAEARRIEVRDQTQITKKAIRALIDS